MRRSRKGGAAPRRAPPTSRAACSGIAACCVAVGTPDAVAPTFALTIRGLRSRDDRVGRIRRRLADADRAGRLGHGRFRTRAAEDHLAAGAAAALVDVATSALVPLRVSDPLDGDPRAVIVLLTWMVVPTVLGLWRTVRRGRVTK